MSEAVENCIVCGKPVKTKREGKIHDECYTEDVMFAVIDGDDEP